MTTLPENLELVYEVISYISKHCDDGYRCGVKDITNVNSLVWKQSILIHFKYFIENLELNFLIIF